MSKKEKEGKKKLVSRRPLAAASGDVNTDGALSVSSQQYLFAKGWELNQENPGFALSSDIIIEKNVRVKMRDGCELSANIFRPGKIGKFPVLMTFTTYHKDLSGWATNKGLKNPISRECPFEAPDPGYWVPNDYVLVIFDDRGYGLSKGARLGAREGEDYYDGIEWAAEQWWSNGKVGMTGVSALANCQWHAAAANPPHLKAVCIWEGFGASDALEPFKLGPRYWGITEFQFSRQMVWWLAPLNSALGQSSPVTRPSAPLDLTKIAVPAVICVSHDQELHQMGGMWGYEHINSKYKWFFSHGRHKWDVYYSPEALAFQKQFFDCFLKGDSKSGILETPRVRLEIRDTIDRYEVRYENDWPIVRTQYKKLYLDATTGKLSWDKPCQTDTVTYESADGAAKFSIKFDEEIEITGNMAAYLWVSPLEVRDMDLIVKLSKLDSSGNIVYFDHCHAPGTYEVASGWWRLSWRELNTSKSRPEWPIPTFGTPKYAQPGEVIQAIFNIYFSSTVFHKGETLQVFIAGSNKYTVTNTRFMYEFLNFGKHTVYTGGKYDSHLLIPVMPPVR